jgi:glycosyltransferase involved in cell wall biosynthesis
MSILKTLFHFFVEKPGIIFVQNPSMILAAIACVYCKVEGLPLVVDRHSTFQLDNPISNFWKRHFFFLLHKFTIQNACLTIVTNEHLAELVKTAKGTPFVLPDPLPAMTPTCKKTLKGQTSILVPSSFRWDEPIDQIVEAAVLLMEKGIYFYFTGNYRKHSADFVEKVPANVVVTGFVPDQEYIDLLYSVDAVMTLTKATSCMLCGCYEAVSAGKPLITSDKPALRQYFYDAVFVDNSVQSVVQACLEIADRGEIYRERTRRMKEEIFLKWGALFQELDERVNKMGAAP